MNEHRPRPADIRLRALVASDLPLLFRYETDPDASRMAVVNPRDAEAFDAHWAGVLDDPSVVVRAIVADGQMVGQISCFKMDGQDAVGYAVDKDHWGRGIATRALALLLEEVTIRPLHARAARSNGASIRVLERCGFTVTGYAVTPASERYPECEEAFLLLT